MSRRTSEANKAIEQAWKREQELVRNGKGTRDWTPEQQRSILEYGKAYDTDGKAFEGQHMRSADRYPEYQGNPDNIQFLTRKEHLEAHDGNWKNPTNWYYDPVTGKKSDFGDGPIVPCKEVVLSKPLNNGGTCIELSNEQLQTDALDNKVRIDKKAGKAKNVANGIGKVGGTALKMIGKGLAATGKFAIAHADVIAYAALMVVAAAASGSSGGSGTGGNSLSMGRNQNNNNSKGDYTNGGGSMPEQTVSPHGQHYHTKQGVIWKDKDSYKRGGKG